jgi:hypothetical protein
MVLNTIDFYVRRVNGQEKRRLFEDMALKEFSRYLDNIVNWSEWYFEHMSEYDSSIELECDFNGLPYE